MPYLIDYPYGCTEQTLSRFLPAVIVTKTLMDQGLKPGSIRNKIFGGIETRHTGKTHPKGKRNIAELDAMTRSGLDRLYDFQHSDGGWSWWKKGDSDHFMTAYVLWGLTLAQQSGIEVDRNVLGRAYRFLNKELVETEDQHDLQAWILHALSTYHAATKLKRVDNFQDKAFDNLWKNRSRLNAYTRSPLALAAHHYRDKKRAMILIENLENGVIIDKTPDTSIIQRCLKKSQQGVMATSHWGGEDGIFYRWSNGGVEATAFALRALLTIDPKNKLVEPAMNWLIKNRRGANWSNTRDTAIVVLAMNDYLKTSGELKGGMEYELQVNGKTITTQKVKDVLRAPSRFEIDLARIKDGVNTIRLIRKGGEGPLYFAANATFFGLEEPITAAGNEIFVRRQYYKLVGRPTLLKGYIYDKVPLNDGETVASGERIETVLTIEAKNHYEYLVFEDMKPAGLEAVQIKSGESLYAQELKQSAVKRALGESTNLDRLSKKSLRGRRRVKSAIIPTPPTPNSDYTGRNRGVYQELRDRKVALFIDKLPQGVWQIRYTLRAEVPGRFHALPVLGHAMYIPEIRANGAEIRIQVSDNEEE